MSGHKFQTWVHNFSCLTGWKCDRTRQKIKEARICEIKETLDEGPEIELKLFEETKLVFLENFHTVFYTIVSNIHKSFDEFCIFSMLK